jgi:hypothetical protein
MYISATEIQLKIKNLLKLSFRGDSYFFSFERDEYMLDFSTAQPSGGIWGQNYVDKNKKVKKVVCVLKSV